MFIYLYIFWFNIVLYVYVYSTPTRNIYTLFNIQALYEILNEIKFIMCHACLNLWKCIYYYIILIMSGKRLCKVILTIKYVINVHVLEEIIFFMQWNMGFFFYKVLMSRKIPFLFWILGKLSFSILKYSSKKMLARSINFKIMWGFWSVFWFEMLRSKLTLSSNVN